MNKLKLSLSIYIFGSKIDSSPSKFIKINFYFEMFLSARFTILCFLNFTFVYLKISAINLHLILLFLTHFSDKFFVESSKRIVSLKRTHFFLSEYIFFYLMRSVVLEIFDFKVFDLIEKMNENATLSQKLHKVKDKKRYILIEQSKLNKTVG